MRKVYPKVFLLILLYTTSSCKKELEKIIETDYKVIEFDYGFDNYMSNYRSESDAFIIKERNLVMINVDKDGLTKIEGSIIDSSRITNRLTHFIFPNPEDEEMPITIEQDFELSGQVIMNKNLLILAKYSKELNYEKYLEIRKKIYLAYNLVRNEFCVEKFDKDFIELINSSEENDKIRLREVKQAIPIRYAEIVN